MSKKTEKPILSVEEQRQAQAYPTQFRAALGSNPKSSIKKRLFV